MLQDDPRFAAAITAMECENFEASFDLVEELATEGGALAQHFLGWHYHRGLGTVQSDAKAAYWWKQAAAVGITEAQQDLGWAYENGRGVRRDYAEAYHWYNQAVHNGDEDARFNLFAIVDKLTTEQIREVEGLYSEPVESIMATDEHG